MKLPKKKKHFCTWLNKRTGAERDKSTLIFIDL